jgi:hypothetical protein
MVASADPTACASQDEVLASNTATESNVHWRTLISAVLILVLLPISSVAAVCDMNCRTNGMPSMAMHSMSRHAGHRTSPATQHHHQLASDSNPNAIAAVSYQVLASHACCNGLLRTLTSPCSRSQNNTLQEQIVAPKWSPNPGIVQTQVSGLLLFKENLIFKDCLSRNSIPLASVPPALSHSLSLRI